MDAFRKARLHLRELKTLQVPLYAGNACCFLVLAAFPTLILLSLLLRRMFPEAAELTGILEGFLPAVFRQHAGMLVARIYEKTSGVAMGLSAVTAVWSASRGMFGILRGLKAVYRREENRGWLYERLVSFGYTLAFLAALPATLLLHGFGGALLGLKWMLPPLQTAIFTAMYMTVSGGENALRESLPGAMLACAGWQVFSAGYSLYVTHFARLLNVYGSQYLVPLSMLWLYGCLCIFLYGGALNAALQRRKKDVTEP